MPLSFTSHSLFVSNSIKADVYSLSNDWLTGSDYRIISINTETADKTVKIIVLGEGELPDITLLEEQVRGRLFGRPLRLETVQSNSYIIVPE